MRRASSPRTAGGTTLESFSYSYTNPTTQVPGDVRFSSTDSSGVSTSYSYDALDRLLQATSSRASYSYSYDGAGNRLSATTPGGTTNYSYNAGNELTSSSGASSVSYTYDADGNLTGSSAGLALTYNAKQQTTSITPVGASSAIAYTYAGTDQTERVEAGDELYTNSVQGVSSQYVSGNTSAKTYFTRDPNNNLISERTPSGEYYYLLDGLGSVVGLTDSSGNLAASYSYDPYGNLVSCTGGDVAANNPWRYAGGYFDAATGFYHFGARYYDPSTGRWTQQDPIAGSLSAPGSY